MKLKTIRKYFLCFFAFSFLCLTVFFLFSHSTLADYKYTPLEHIPGFESAGSDFPAFVLGLYQFGIWVIGICAILMITVGGFMYLISAGNTSKMENAKKIITDALLGLIIALGAYFLLYTINPNLVNVTINIKPLTTGTGTTGVGTTGGKPGVGTTGGENQVSGKACNDGKCSQVDGAINSNASGIEPAILKSILVGGEGCSSKLSYDGKGSCGYSQALPKIRAWCGITGSNTETCAAVQNDVQLDVNCAAKLISSNAGRCGMDIQQVASCYNVGQPNLCAKSTDNYCGRVSAYYDTCKGN